MKVISTLYKSYFQWVNNSISAGISFSSTEDICGGKYALGKGWALDIV